MTNIFKSRWPCCLRHRFAAACSNPAEGMGDFHVTCLLCFVGSGLCDGLIPR